LVVLNSQPMLDPHSAHDAIVQAYLRNRITCLGWTIHSRIVQWTWRGLISSGDKHHYPGNQLCTFEGLPSRASPVALFTVIVACTKPWGLT
jgi:hypothetical protein